MIEASELLDEWFSKPLSDHWFSSTPEIDAYLRQKYEPLWQQAYDGKLAHWHENADGSLALIILLDQLPLNMFRGQATSFSTEQLAVETCKQGIERGFDKLIDKNRQGFYYMPLMHSEAPGDQALSVQMFEAAGLEHNLRFAHHHQELIRRFGRFPHRNAILGRASTPEEIEYLASKEAFRG